MVKTALIVDDSRLARLTLKRLLGKYDIQVFEAEGVLDAEMWLSRNPLPDIVFMDIMMPELDGYEGLARLRAEPETQKLPVIMYSGDISDEARKKARDAGATGYLPKPADAGRLDHLLTALQDRMRQEAANRPAPVRTPPQAPPPPPVQHTPEPAPVRPTFNVADAENEFGLGGGHKTATEAPIQEKAPFTPPQQQQSTPNPHAATLQAMHTDVQPMTTTVVSGISEDEGNEIRRRLDILEKDISSINVLLQSLEEKVAKNTASAAAASKPSLTAEIERHHKDVVLLQGKITENEKQSKLALIAGGAGLFLGLVACIWHLF